jgi:fluoroacetyl-CoA thioesterase
VDLVGAQARLQRVVGADDTAVALGSGDVPVLATPRLLAWAEAATVAALAGRLDEGATSVGSRVQLEHRAASPIGAAVTVTAEVVDVDGRQVRLAVAATHHDGTTVAAGEITRTVVDRARFVERVTRP